MTLATMLERLGRKREILTISEQLARSREVIDLIERMQPLADELQRLDADPNGVVAAFLNEKLELFQGALESLGEEQFQQHYQGGEGEAMSGHGPVETKADTEALLAEQLKAVEAYDAVDSELQDAEVDLESLVDEMKEHEEAIAAAKVEREKHEPRVAELQKRLDAAWEAWVKLSDQLDAEGVEEQYLIENSLSEYGQHNYA
jgi:hypothetical protein